jgi:hypothetical protein
LVIVTIILRILSVTLSRDDEATTSHAILGRNNVVVIGGNTHVRTWESDRYSLSFSGWKSIGIFLVGAPLATDLETREIGIWTHLVVGALHLASITDRYR